MLVFTDQFGNQGHNAHDKGADCCNQIKSKTLKSERALELYLTKSPTLIAWWPCRHGWIPHMAKD